MPMAPSTSRTPSRCWDTCSAVPPRRIVDSADANDDGAMNIADAIATLGHLFGGAGPLPAPFGACGEDGTAVDALDCKVYAPCGRAASSHRFRRIQEYGYSAPRADSRTAPEHDGLRGPGARKPVSASRIRWSWAKRRNRRAKSPQKRRLWCPLTMAGIRAVRELDLHVGVQPAAGRHGGARRRPAGVDIQRRAPRSGSSGPVTGSPDPRRPGSRSFPRWCARRRRSRYGSGCPSGPRKFGRARGSARRK